MKRYRAEFIKVWGLLRYNLGMNLGKVLSKKGEIESKDGQSYLHRQVAVFKMFDKKYKLEQALRFSIRVEFNVTDVTEELKRSARENP